jgi:hypothetical protein
MVAAATSSPAAMVVFRQPAALGGRRLAALTQGISLNPGNFLPRIWIWVKSIWLLKESIQLAKIGQYSRIVYLTYTVHHVDTSGMVIV